MTIETAIEKFKEYEKTEFALRHATGVIYYDGATVAPKASDDVRGITLSELSRMQYELASSESTDEIIKTLTMHKDELDPVTRKKVEEINRNNERIKKIPVEEYVAYTELSNKSFSVWREAKEKNNFSMFCPYLQKMFDMTKKLAGYTDPDKDPYEASMDNFERGLTKKTCDEFFDNLREKLIPLIKEVSGRQNLVDDSPFHQKFPIDTQRKFSDYLMDLICIDKNRCIIGETEHPFTTSFSKYDVRITTHYYEDDFASSLYSVVHEGGHALYELHSGDNLAFSSLEGGVSMAIHESQSRFYENIIGRSREFCGLIYPWLRDNFKSQLDGISGEEFYRMINKSCPSLIRTEADELTYSMHVLIRYELEKAVFDGALKAEDLPGEWNALYKKYLGIDVPDDRRGVLQDSHWSDGNIGYFPSYALGSAYGAQFLHEMEKDFDVFTSVKDNNIKRINDWLEDKIWKYGCLKDPVELFESVCGKFNPAYYTEYLEKKFKDIYHI